MGFVRASYRDSNTDGGALRGRGLNGDTAVHHANTFLHAGQTEPTALQGFAYVETASSITDNEMNFVPRNG